MAWIVLIAAGLLQAGPGGADRIGNASYTQTGPTVHSHRS